MIVLKTALGYVQSRILIGSLLVRYQLIFHWLRRRLSNSTQFLYT